MYRHDDDFVGVETCERNTSDMIIYYWTFHLAHCVLNNERVAGNMDCIEFDFIVCDVSWYWMHYFLFRHQICRIDQQP